MRRSSINLELLLYLHSYYFATFVFLEVCFGIYKIVSLPIQSNNIIIEVLIHLFLVCIELVRIQLGRKGNLTETLLPLIVSTILTGPSVAGIWYLLRWQSYVLWLELIMCYIQLSMQGVEFVLALVSICTFYKYTSY